MKSFLKLWPFIRPQWKLVFGSVALSIPLSVIRFSPAPMIKYLMDSVLIKKEMHMLYLLPLGVVGVYFINIVVRFSHAYFGRLANERIMASIRERLFQHYLGLSNSFFNESSVGKLISRVTNDVFYVSQGTINIVNLSKELITFCVLFGYAAFLNLKLLVITLVVGPLLIWLGKRSGILMKNYSLKMQEANGYVYSSLQEAFSGFRIIKAFALENFAFRKFKEKNDEYVCYALKAARVEEIGGPMVEFMSAIAIALVIYVGGRDVIHDRLTAGQLLAFFTCFGLLIQPVRNLNDINMKLNNAAASADRVDETLSLRSEIIEKENPKIFHGIRSEITFQNLSFRYASSMPWVLKNMNFSIPRGQMIALVGASGQGKSTLMSILPRFYDPTEGKVLIDGQDIQDFSLESLRSQMSFVTQDVFLFNDTIYANIASGNPKATKQEVYAAAEAACAMPFIEKLPDGFETKIGDRGQKLSGGERQRVSIARAILRNSPILLLDEATSSLDSESEKAVQEALEKLMQGRTTLVIAHRLSTIKDADKIHVIANGNIIETGTHDELLKAGREYARFYALLK